MVRVFARAKSKPGHADALRAVLQKLVQASCAEDGVLVYELFETAERGEFFFREEYADSEAFERHRTSRHVRVAVGRAASMMDGELTLWFVEPVL
jgi:quinol monooxygenase YgiN